MLQGKTVIAGGIIPPSSFCVTTTITLVGWNVNFVKCCYALIHNHVVREENKSYVWVSSATSSLLYFLTAGMPKKKRKMRRRRSWKWSLEERDLQIINWVWDLEFWNWNFIPNGKEDCRFGWQPESHNSLKPKANAIWRGFPPRLFDFWTPGNWVLAWRLIEPR